MLELFFDLAFVLVFTQLSHNLANHLTWLGLAETVVLTTALWWTWSVITWVTDIYDSAHPGLQVLVIVLTFAVVAMAVTIHGAFANSSLMFASAYVGAHLIRASVLVVAVRNQPIHRRPPLRILAWSLATTPFWFIGGALHGRAQLLLWTAAIGVDYTAAATRWPVPILSRSPAEEWELTGEHLAERYRQILLIGLGDVILTVGAAWVDSPATPLRGAVLLLGFVLMVLLWQTYYRSAAERLAALLAGTRNKARVSQLVVDCHLLMMLGIVFTAVGLELVVRHPAEHRQEFWGVLVVGGPAVFMLGRVLLGRLVLGRLSPSRVVTLAGLVTLAPFSLLLRPLTATTATTLILSLVQVPRANKRLARRIREPELDQP